MKCNRYLATPPRNINKWAYLFTQTMTAFLLFFAENKEKYINTGWPLYYFDMEIYLQYSTSGGSVRVCMCIVYIRRDPIHTTV